MGQEYTGVGGRAKCDAIEGLGRALHGAQDFYAHSNWSDEADPGRPIGTSNPPGLNLPGPSPILDLRGAGTPSVPTALTTGCFILRDRDPGVGECTNRVTHAALNKDTGLIDTVTGTTTGPTKPRGQVRANFDKAVQAAIPGRAGRPVRGQARVTDDLCAYPGRPGERLPGRAPTDTDKQLTFPVPPIDGCCCGGSCTWSAGYGEQVDRCGFLITDGATLSAAAAGWVVAEPLVAGPGSRRDGCGSRVRRQPCSGPVGLVPGGYGQVMVDRSPRLGLARHGSALYARVASR
jgi:hypothetical protein